MACEDCLKGPHGIEGHPAIVPDADATVRAPVYVCTTCKQQFTRHYEGGGVFIWIPTEAMKAK